jgi:nitrogen fixation/metabolism regulation signal transduction histidine kinase
MDDANVRLRRGNLALAACLVVGLVGLGLLTETVQNFEVFGRWHDTVLIVNLLAALTLLTVLSVNLVRLLRERRQQVPGARLKLRMLVAFAAIAAGPLLVVFLVSILFLDRGIGTWADERIALDLEHSLQLSRAALDAELRADLEKTEAAAARLAELAPAKMIAELAAIRRETGAREMSVFGRNYRIVATSSAGAPGSIPELPSEDVLLQLPRDGRYVAAEPTGPGALEVRAAATLGGRADGSGELLFLQAIYPVGEQLGALAESIQKTYTRYGELVFLREPLESSFTVALSVAVLLALFTALFAALVFARRLVAPIRNLVAGTRAVAAGNLGMRLPVTSHDDIGALVESFNEMTARLAAAGEQARRNAEAIERSATSLATVLARLTSGVIAVDSRRRLRIANDAAGAILHTDLRAAAGQSLEDIGRRDPQLEAFFQACEARSRESAEGWREQIVLAAENTGRRVLMCSAAPLPDEQGPTAGWVLVFEDITAMLQAQREAAWGEVARRLAHEIKNPLTPIQLSAERIRRRYLGSLSGTDTEVLDRATHTIVQQVEAMRDMVNAFSDYARAPEISFAALDLNGLVREVADLYHGPQQPELRLELDASLTSIEADAVRLRQLLHNLIRNACEALESHAGALVTIGTRRLGEGAEGAAEIRVQDNGPGIDPELLDRIFDPYVTNKTRGTGLGLAIVRRLVDDHGGTIAAENLPGGGACVKVTLPLSQRRGDTQADIRLRRAGERR